MKYRRLNLIVSIPFLYYVGLYLSAFFIHHNIYFTLFILSSLIGLYLPIYYSLYYLKEKNYFEKDEDLKRLDLNPIILILWFISFCFMGFYFLTLSYTDWSKSMPRLFYYSFLLSLLLSSLTIRSKNVTLRNLIIILQGIVIIGIGNREWLFEAFILALLILCFSKAKKVVNYLAIFMALIIIIAPSQKIIRTLVSDTQNNYNWVDEWKNYPNVLLDFSVRILAEPLNAQKSFQHILQNNNYKSIGELQQDILISLKPRLLYPQKPNLQPGIEIGTRLLGKSNGSHQPIGLPTELFWTFGFWTPFILILIGFFIGGMLIFGVTLDLAKNVYFFHWWLMSFLFWDHIIFMVTSWLYTFPIYGLLLYLHDKSYTKTDERNQIIIV